MLETLTFELGSGDYRIVAVVVLCGEDVTIVAGGGSRPHIGAVATAISLPSLKDPGRLTTTASVMSVPGHKEDQVVRAAALQLAKTLETTVTVSAGLHVDNATPADIEQLVNHFNELVEQIAHDLQQRLPGKTSS
jgi:hypothetical protein